MASTSVGSSGLTPGTPNSLIERIADASELRAGRMFNGMRRDHPVLPPPGGD
jgi:hypothetical protein